LVTVTGPVPRVVLMKPANRVWRPGHSLAGSYFHSYKITIDAGSLSRGNKLRIIII
jgi:hypothetical protein